jgi:hypothetical protein
LAIEKVFPKAPSDVLHAALSLLQKWIMLLKEATDGECPSLPGEGCGGLLDAKF